jgi:hypothetical protein
MFIPFLARGRIAVTRLSIPPPPPWHWGDLRALLKASQILSTRAPAGLGEARWQRGIRKRSRRLDWPLVDSCIGTARHLLSRWPVADATELGWLPTEVAGGVEEAQTTERALGSSRAPLARKAEGRAYPVATARRFSRYEPRESGLVATAAESVLRSFRLVVESYASDPRIAAAVAAIEQPLATVAFTARPSAIAPDPPFSTLPAAFRSFVSAALAATSELSSVGSGHELLPLAHVWELYEDWVAERVLAVVERLMARPPDTRSGACFGRWTLSDGSVEVLIQPRFPLGQAFTVGDARFQTVLGDELRPDVVVAVSRKGRTRLLVIDAKDRPSLDGSTLAAESAKYLWGIRRCYDAAAGSSPAEVPAIEAVLLVAPDGGSDSVIFHLGRALTVPAAPHRQPSPARGPASEGLTAKMMRLWLLHLGV